MEHLEGRQSVLAALRAYQRRFQVILIRHDGHREKLAEVIELAGQRGVPIRYVEAAELDALAHGATHGGVVAICSAKPRMTPGELLAMVDGEGNATAEAQRGQRTQRRSISKGEEAPAEGKATAETQRGPRTQRKDVGKGEETPDEGNATAEAQRGLRTRRENIGKGGEATGGEGGEPGIEGARERGAGPPYPPGAGGPQAAGTHPPGAGGPHEAGGARRREAALLLLLEGVDDARNLGFTLRSAEALGVHAVLIKKHLWDFDAVEVGRPAAGAYERLPLVQVEDVEVLRQLQKRGVRVIGCVAGAKRSVYEAELAGPVVLAIGGEKRGLSGAVRAVCDQFVSIPMRGEASSLSLSHAASIVMAEAMRQRRAARQPQRRGGGGGRGEDDEEA